MTSSVCTRRLRREELGTVMAWMVAETWHVSLNILTACYDLDPQGWIAAEATHSGELIGSITGCILDEQTAFGGFFIVRPDWRRRGVGKALWAARMRYLGQRNFGIDAVEARVEYDRDNGFTQVSFPIAAFMGHPKRESLVMGDVAGISVKRYTATAAEESKLIAYDSKMHTMARAAFLKQWASVEVTTTYVAKDDLGGVVGYGCIQPIEGGHFHVGPVFAETPDIGRKLLNELFLSVPEGKQVGFDIPLDNALSVEFSRQHGMMKELKLYRMYTDKILDFEMDKVFAFTTMGIALI